MLGSLSYLLYHIILSLEFSLENIQDSSLLLIWPRIDIALWFVKQTSVQPYFSILFQNEQSTLKVREVSHLSL